MVLNEVVGIPFYIIIVGISSLLLSGLGVGSYFGRFQDKKNCDQIHQREALNMEQIAKDMTLIKNELKEQIRIMDENFRDSIRRLHTRIDELYIKVGKNDYKNSTS
jgi:hypothetical protein